MFVNRLYLFMLNKTFRPLLHCVAIFLIALCLFTLQSKAQIIDRVLENFEKYHNISYTSSLQNKDLFSDDVFLDTLHAIETLKNKATFRLKGNIQEDIYDGQKVFKLNYKDSTYRISDKPNDCFYYDKSLSYLVGHLKTLVQKGKKEVQLKDSIYNGKSYFQLQFTEADAVINGKRVYIINRLLVDKKTYLIYWNRKEVEAFIDGTTTFIKFFSEYHFSNFKINLNDLPDLSQTILPSYFSLEKPKVPMVLLDKGVSSPALTIVDLKGKATEISAYKGKVVLLNFTISGCPHCIEAIETLNSLSTKYKNTDFQILSINPFDDRESILKFNERFKQNYPTFTSAKNTKEIYRINGYPTFYLIDANGEIVKGYEGFSKSIGDLMKEDIANLIEQK